MLKLNFEKKELFVPSSYEIAKKEQTNHSKNNTINVIAIRNLKSCIFI
jgi:hypothetical protein